MAIMVVAVVFEENFLMTKSSNDVKQDLIVSTAKGALAWTTAISDNTFYGGLLHRDPWIFGTPTFLCLGGDMPDVLAAGRLWDAQKENPGTHLLLIHPQVHIP